MKRTLTILLVLCLMLSFAACGSKPSGNTPSNVPSGNEQASEPSDTELKGVIKDDAYENEYLDVRIPLPSGWVFYNEEHDFSKASETIDLSVINADYVCY